MGTAPRVVTILIDSLLGGGAERVAVDTATALDPRRYQPHVLVTRCTGPLEDTLREHSVAYTILGRDRGFRPDLLAKSCTIVRHSDLLHAHKFEGSMWGALLSRLARRPLVAHEHTFDGSRTVRRTTGYRYWIAPRASRIVCVSETVRDSLVVEGVRPSKLVVIANGVRLDTTLPRSAARAELGLDPGWTVVGMIGRLRPEKRHEVALEAFASLHRENPATKLCIVGGGSRATELKAIARELGLGEHVVWTGELRDAGRLVKAFDVTLLSSSFEGMPLAALESLVAGVPVVATAVGSLPSLLADGGGCAVPPGDAAALARGLALTLTRASGLTPSRVEQARASFGLPRVVIELQAVYDSVLGIT